MMKLIIRYFGDVDFLTLGNGRRSDSGEDVSAGLTAFFDDADDSVVSFTIQSAVRDLAPVLYGKESAGGRPVRRKAGQQGYLEDVPLLIEYRRDCDTLRLGNGGGVSRKQAVADTLSAEFDGDGGIVGFTLERAAKQLSPFLADLAG